MLTLRYTVENHQIPKKSKNQIFQNSYWPQCGEFQWASGSKPNHSIMKLTIFHAVYVLGCCFLPDSDDEKQVKCYTVNMVLQLLADLVALECKKNIFSSARICFCEIRLGSSTVESFLSVAGMILLG